MARLQQIIMEEKYLNTHIGTINIDHYTSSTKIIIDSTIQLYEKIINKELLVRRVNVTANNVINIKDTENKKPFEQIDLFTDYKQKEKEQQEEKKERNLQKAMINIKSKYGKNAIIKGMNLQEAGTTIDRNNQVGGHKA